MKKFTPMRRYLIPILTFLFLITVTVVEAKGLVPCGGEGEDKCQMCHFVQLGQRILEWFILVSASIIAVMFAWGGFEWVMSGGNTGKIQKGKDKMINALIGLLIILGAYLVVNTIMVTFVDQSVVSNWSSIQCVQQPSRTGGGGSNPGSQPGGTNPADGGVQDPNQATGSNAVTDAAANMINGTCVYSQERRNNCTGDPGYTDCSQFTQQAFAQAGCATKLANTSTAQYNQGTPITNQSSLRAGDVIVYPGHSAVCANNGCTQIMDAGGSKSGLSTRNSSWMLQPGQNTRSISCN